MNKQKFVQYLRTPAKLDQQSMVELEAVINEFPYFQSARTLLAKVSKQNKSKKAAKYVGSAAIYATDRALLKRYINDQLIFLNPLEVHESHEAELERDLNDTIKTTRIVSAHVKQTSAEEKAPPKKKPITRPKPEATEPQQPKPIAEKPENVPSAPSSDLDHIIEELYKDMEELKANRAKFQKIESQLAEDEAVDNAVKKATDKASRKEPKVDNQVEKQETPKKESKPKPENAKPEPKTSKEEVEEPSDKEEVKAKPLTEQDEPKKEAPLKKASESRSARRTSKIETEKKVKDEPKKKVSKKASPKTAKTTKTKKASKPSGTVKSKTASKSKTSTKKDTSKKTTGKKATTKSGKSTKTTKSDSGKKEDKGDKKSQQDDIITNFIKINPSISPGDSKAPKSTEDLSGNSTELHPDIASEYLAEIYLEQGLTERAVQIYESLMVRIPEKSVYFADIIKKLKEEK